jgi:hypothetical protein
LSSWGTVCRGDELTSWCGKEDNSGILIVGPLSGEIGGVALG